MDSNELSDGSPLCTDYTAAAVIDDVTRLVSIRRALAGIEGQETTLTRTEFNEQFLEETGVSNPLTDAEFNALMVSLANSGAAEESETGPGGYSQYTFLVRPQNALRVLDQQIIAYHSNQQLSSPAASDNHVQVVATVPREIRSDLDVEVGKLSLSLRRMLLDASEVVRVANPYFDPEQWILDDLRALPQRGVDTRILTRETAGEDADDEALEAVSTIVSGLDGEEIQHMEIRDFYETTATGKQTGAVHAKLISVDDNACYIGSANLTDLNLKGNFEVGVILQGQLVCEINEVFDAVFDESDPIPI